MTRNEAEDRARRIWAGAQRLRPGPVDGEWTVEAPVLIKPGDRRHIHTMDANGHACCHKACSELEANLLPGKPQ